MSVQMKIAFKRGCSGMLRMITMTRLDQHGRAMIRALVIAGSMGSFEPMDFWKLLNSSIIIHRRKISGFRTPNMYLDVQEL